MSPFTTPTGRKMKTAPKLAILAAGILVAVFGLQYGASHGWIPSVGIGKSLSLTKTALPDIREAKITGVEPLPFPSNEPAEVAGPHARFLMWAWNAQMGTIYANGGATTTRDSLMAKHGVNLHIERQDDTNQMITELANCAKDLKDATECTSGAQFMAIMGDQSAAFFGNANRALAKVCDDCVLEWVGSGGRSDGEDAFMGPQAWKDNPQSSKGGTVITVLREGDWNIVVKWASDNQIKVNPDETTYDADAINFINAATNQDAGEKFVANYCEDRRAVKDGKLTGNKQHVCGEAVSVWTPVDVTVAKKRGGVTRIVSTHQYRSQMPHAIIGIKKWNKAHPKTVAGILAATFEAGDQIRAFPQALAKAGELSAQVYGEQDGDYWVKYYRGVQEEDAAGNMVELGGSKVYGLADNLNLFGLAPGSNNNAKATYNVFGNYAKTLYPKLIPDLPKFEEVFNPAYLQQAKVMVGRSASADVAHFSESAISKGVVSRRDVEVEFDTGQATLRPEGKRLLVGLRDDLAIAGNLMVILHGYTDNVGDPDSNQRLSEARAKAVKNFLVQTAPTDFPSARFRVYGHGQQDPVADNANPQGRAKNRRVKIVLANSSES